MEDELVGILGKLVEFVENASPVIWEVAQKQVVANIVSSAIWAVVLLLAIIGLVRLVTWAYVALNETQAYNEGKSYYTKKDPDGYAAVFAFASMFAIIVTVVFFYVLTDIARMAINPAYYAIENILSMVR